MLAGAPGLNAEKFYELVLDNIDDPYPTYRQFRDADGLHRIMRPGTGREPEWLVMRYDAAATVLTGRGFGRRAAVPGSLPAAGAATIVGREHPVLSTLVENWLVFMDPPRHTMVRSIVSDCLAKRVRAGFREKTEKIVRDLVARISAQLSIEFVSEFATVVPMLVNLETLGVPRADWRWMCERTTALQEGSSFRPGNRKNRLATAEDAALTLDEYFRAALSERRRIPREDLMSDLLAAEWGDCPVDDDLLVGTCVHILAAGNETMRNALSKIVLLLLRNKEILNILLIEPALAPDVIDELVRLDPPAQMVTRWAYRDERIAGHDVSRGDKITIVLGSANRDPARFCEPDTLRLDRPRRQHGGFGMGIHYCLGSALARVETEVSLDAMLTLLPELRVASDPVCYGKDLIFHGPQELRLVRT
ncbi:MAG TPA: cytochrome P450 [Pseudonocardiaceae bacterium]|jgi:cytochrome P450